MQRVAVTTSAAAAAVALQTTRRWLRKRPGIANDAFATASPPSQPTRTTQYAATAAAAAAARTAQSPLPHAHSNMTSAARAAAAAAATATAPPPPPAATTLERIRAEVRAMHNEAQAAAAARQRANDEAAARREQQRAQREAQAAPLRGDNDDDALDAALRDALRRRHKPSSAYYTGDDVRASVAAAQQLTQRAREQEASEVLRRRSRDEVLHYMRLAFPQHTVVARNNSSSSDTATSRHARRASSNNNNDNADDDVSSRAARVATVARALEARVAAAKEAIRTRPRNSGSGSNTMSSDGRDAAAAALSERDVATLAWVDVLEAMSDSELRQLRDCGLLDAEAIAELCADDDDDNDDKEGEHNTLLPTTTAATMAPSHTTANAITRDGKGDTNVVVDDDDNDDDDALTMDAMLRSVQSLQHAAELTRDICATTLRRAPSPDMAPVMQKVYAQRYDEVTARELQMLEAYEEVPVTLRVRTHTSSGSRDDHDNDNSGAHDVCDTVAYTDMRVTQSLLDRALLPSNWLLEAVAQRDARLRRGLDALERVRRSTLLDEQFQGALRLASALEAPLLDSVRRQVGHAPPAREHTTTRTKTATTTRTTTTTGMRVSAARPYHAADLPYFLHSPYSVAPPHARFNLPAPSPSAHERAVERGRRRRARKPRRFVD